MQNELNYAKFLSLQLTSNTLVYKLFCIAYADIKKSVYIDLFTFFLSPPLLCWLTGTPFPKTFMQVAKKILSRLFRVFVHVYIHHFDRVSQMGAEAHVNTCYKHFYYFVTEFNLTDHKELEPLVSLLAAPRNGDPSIITLNCLLPFFF